MTQVRPTRLWLTLALVGVAIGATAVDVTAKPKPAPAAEAPPPPPPPPPMPSIGMSERLVDEAAAYEGFMRRAALISPAFADGPGVAQALKVGAGYEPSQLLKGEVAYAAIAALQDPAFVDAVRTAGATPEGRYAIVSKIFADPANVFGYRGASGAAGLAKDALAGDGMRLFNAGKSVKQAAYDIQRQPWSLQDIADRDAREEEVKSLSKAQMPITPDDTTTLQQASSGQPAMALAPDEAAPPYSPLITRAVALAALAAIGQAGDDQIDNLGWLFDSYFTDRCLADAKRALYECLAVAKPHYEDVFCLGQHAMSDTGACVVKGAGSTVPLEIATQPLRIPPVHGHHGRRRQS